MSRKLLEHHEWTDQLSDYLAGELTDGSLQKLQAHLDGCGSCRRVLEGLHDVVSRSGALGNIEPPRDLWGGIAAVIQAPVTVATEVGAKVIALPTAGRLEGASRSALGPSRFTLTARQLVAASLVLIAASATATWLVGPGLGVPVTGSAASAPGFVTMVSEVPGPSAGLAADLAALEASLAAAEGVLDPNTLRILERNLGVIEQAIQDSRSALAQDPGNEFLTDHLERVYQRKLTYLRDAARVVESAG
ncbi:MAG: zf-HC2 domain-containing protein [Gemmatimonadetes bacterium]|nr:zf-HC2 domain-containing protein [Gemmatimonadota bacterium]MDA1102804.1 zf-HC2 domain-containing protein [Gemmatimonadota bacterium]